MKTDPVAHERFWSTIRADGGGWAKPPRSRKWHFFRGKSDHEARLCHDYYRFEPAPTVHADAPSPADRCSACVDRLASEFLRWNAAAPIYLLTLRRITPCPQCGAIVEWWTRPQGCIWLPPVDPSTNDSHTKGDQVYLDEAGMQAALPEFHRNTCPDGYLYMQRKPWFAHAEDDALEQYQRRLDAKGE